MILKTERLILRPIMISDANDIFEYSKDPDVGPNAGWKPHENIEETINIMEDIFVGQDEIFGIVLKNTGKMIGSIGFMKDPKRLNTKARMLGYSLSKKYWGHGFMTEAAKEILKFGFENLNIEIISAYCYPHNTRLKKVLNKCGFEYEGKLRKCEILYNGETFDNECYSILKSGFKNNKKTAI
ncbi:MAG: GNAT family N-acetyltransferase [Clostridia bacterium]|jgi:putative acetyltransferase|nr:GNAT family N-acetyltransferase [Clostridia bacterium]